MENLMKRHYVADQTNDVVDVADPVSFASIAALSAQIWEAIICFGDEVEYLWRGKIRAVKLLYACSRYLMLLGQVATQVLSFCFYTQQRRRQRLSLCPGIYVFQSIYTQMGLLILELVIIIRVFALYNHTQKAKWFLSLIFIISASLETSGTIIFIRSIWTLKECRSLRTEHLSIYLFGAGVGTAQIVLVLATIVRLTRRYRSGQSPTPLSTMVMNQGLAIFVLVFASVAHMMVNNFFREVNMGNGNSTASWYNSITSIGASRLILEIRKLARSDNEHCPANNLEDSETIVLTVISEPDLQINEVSRREEADV